jgi:3-polyprenyl-4-hydroxybenzoate decarboxylase
MTQKLIIGITGASGVVYGIALLKSLQKLPVTVHRFFKKL